MKLARAAVVACLLAACAAQQPSLIERAGRAHAEGKAVVVEFYTQWCRVCRRFRETVLPDARVSAAIDDVRYVRLDAEHGSGVGEAERLGVAGYPTFVVLRADGAPAATLRGLPSVERFLDFLEWGQVYAADESSVRAALERGRTRSSLLVAARWNAGSGRIDEAVALYDQVLAIDGAPDLVWERLQVRAAGGTRQVWAESAAGYLAAHPNSRYAEDALRIAALSGGLDAEAFDALITAHLQRIAGSATRLDEVVYVLLAAGRADRAIEVATGLVERWPKLHMFRESLAAAKAGDARVQRAAAQRAWVDERSRDLRIK